MLCYKLRCDRLKDEDNGIYTSFGIDVFQYNTPIRSVKDVSVNKDNLQKLISLLNRLQPDPVHIDDIIQDFLE